MTDDILVALHGEGEHGNEAKCEPRMRLDDMARPVSAVVTLAGDSLVALDLLPESVFATGEYQTHGEDATVCAIVSSAMFGRSARCIFEKEKVFSGYC